MTSNKKGRAARVSQRRRLSTDQRRQELIDTAIGLLGSEPVDAFSMDEVARRAGASRPLLYHYFTSKQELIRAVVAHESATLAGTLEATTLPEALDAYLSYVNSHPHGYQLLHGGPLQADPEVKATVEQTRTTIEKSVIAHLGIENPTELARLAVRGWTGYVIAVCLEWAGNDQPRPDEVRDLLLRALPTPARGGGFHDSGRSQTPGKKQARK